MSISLREKKTKSFKIIAQQKQTERVERCLKIVLNTVSNDDLFKNLVFKKIS